MKIKESEACPCGSGKTFGECHDKLRRARQTPETELVLVPLKVIPPLDPDTRAVFERASGSDSTVFFAGIDGQHALVCGKCSAVLATRVDRQQFAGLVLRCLDCGSFNDT